MRITIPQQVLLTSEIAEHLASNSKPIRLENGQDNQCLAECYAPRRRMLEHCYVMQATCDAFIALVMSEKPKQVSRDA